jgi:hypothetical protein
LGAAGGGRLVGVALSSSTGESRSDDVGVVRARRRLRVCNGRGELDVGTLTIKISKCYLTEREVNKARWEIRHTA